MIAVRWWCDAAAILVVGLVGAEWLRRRAQRAGVTIGHPRTLPSLLMLAAAAYAAGAAAMLAAQVALWFGADGFTDRSDVLTLLTDTVWGQHWLDTADAAVFSLACAGVALIWPRASWAAAACAAATVVAVTPLVGHAAAHGSTVVWMHRAHLMGAGLWLGTLGASLAAMRSLPAEHRRRALGVFAPVALTGAALLFSSGAYLFYDHIARWSSLVETSYGRVLSGKVAAALTVAALGYLNWRGPHWRRAVIEVLVAALVVLSLTAWLSELPMPEGRNGYPTAPGS